MADTSTENVNDVSVQEIRQQYLEATKLIERLHRQFLEVVKTELDRRGIVDINNIQALILFNVGGDELTVGELTNRGYYLGSNVSYNVRKMVENGYLIQERSTHDRRSIRVRLSEKGLSLCNQVSDMFDQHSAAMRQGGIDHGRLRSATECFGDLERFWVTQLNYNLRGGPI